MRGSKEPMENWKAVVGFEGLYEVSTEGRIRSLDRKDCRGNRIKGKTMKPRLINSGYLMVHLRDADGHRSGRLVHRVVAEAFLTASNGEVQVDHMDENKTNNRLTNLRWITPKANTNHGTGIARASANRSKPVNQLNESGELIKRFSSSADAARSLDIKQGSITNCCRGKHIHAGGYRWEYAV